MKHEIAAMVCKVSAEVKKRQLDIGAEIQNHKSNVNKPLVWKSSVKLAALMEEYGYYEEALQQYMTMRDLGSDSQQRLFVYCKAIQLCAPLGYFAQVRSFCTKASAVMNTLDNLEGVSENRCLIDASMGLVLLHERKYKQAAKLWCSVKVEMGDMLHVSIKQVAAYAALTALATFSREEYHTALMVDADGKALIESVPKVRDMVKDFYNGQYKDSLNVVRQCQEVYKYDPFLGTHIDTIVQQVKRHAIKQYLLPYVTVDLVRMASAFDDDVQILQNEIAALIKEKQLDARIDADRKIVQFCPKNARAEAYANALQVASSFVSESKACLLRMNLVRKDMCVGQDEKSGPKRSIEAL